MANSHNGTKESQNTLAKQLPISVMVEAKLTATELKYRLESNQPNLTIVDIRAPKSFDREHIKGAISVPFSRLEDLAQSSLTHHRNIYIYGESDEQSLHGLQILLSTGFINVAQIIGGLTTWREIAGGTEGIGI
ncbi:rhodanese-like domain-containing protein [Chamaesiphon sp. VAR_48_metabat_135_sub]|uniref:rhodanese-like domain-containing protein n=1 Tax=Chamaesiphon sp. VAR_48_metabat_135_sub TaxID=2964699 RepID=UPI00286C20E7|nr:rhodanese-like domain-containing protein [Chamaesiphon sp. VAR_48_metabat_135_sub]